MCESCGTSNAVILNRRNLVKTGAVVTGAFGAAVASRGLIAALAEEATPTVPAAPHWEYEGEEGPENWGEIDPVYETCAIGKEQSPIDLTGTEPTDLSDIEFNDTTLDPVLIHNNGHTIVVSNKNIENHIVLDGVRYELLQFHFHTPSEHTVDGQASAMELHLVHIDEDGELAVVGILINEGAENAALKLVFDNMSAEKGEPAPVEGTLSISDFMPEDKTTFRYMGSLTTPPCSEDVHWNVFANPIEASKEQIEAFRAIFPMDARPVQPLNEREIVEGA